MALIAKISASEFGVKFTKGPLLVGYWYMECCTTVVLYYIQTPHPELVVVLRCAPERSLPAAPSSSSSSAPLPQPQLEVGRGRGRLAHAQLEVGLRRGEAPLADLERSNIVRVRVRVDIMVSASSSPSSPSSPGTSICTSRRHLCHLVTCMSGSSSSSYSHPAPLLLFLPRMYPCGVLISTNWRKKRARFPDRAPTSALSRAWRCASTAAASAGDSAGAGAGDADPGAGATATTTARAAARAAAREGTEGVPVSRRRLLRLRLRLRLRLGLAAGDAPGCWFPAASSWLLAPG